MSLSIESQIVYNPWELFALYLIWECSVQLNNWLRRVWRNQTIRINHQLHILKFIRSTCQYTHLYQWTICEIFHSLIFCFCIHISALIIFRWLTDFVCLYTYFFLLSLWKIVRSSIILLLPLFDITFYLFRYFGLLANIVCVYQLSIIDCPFGFL